MSSRYLVAAAARRTDVLSRHMASTITSSEPLVEFQERLALRRFILNRPKKLNALNTPMLEVLASRIEQWNNADLCGVIVGTGVGKAFSAGGDVAGVIENAANEATLPKAVDFFQREYELDTRSHKALLILTRYGLDYTLSTLSKPYVAIMDGLTFGGGFGLVAPAPFRVATENCSISMPETKIGFFPDVGASYYLSRLDGQIGTYLALTGTSLSGRAAFEHGLATHYIPSARVPMLLDTLATLEKPTFAQVNEAIEDLHYDREPADPVAPLSGATRVALDSAFSQETVEAIVDALQSYATGEESAEVVQWAKNTLTMLEDRSPSSLKIALMAIKKGKSLDLLESFKMELGIADAFCHGASPDFHTGVTSVIVEKKTSRPTWSPASPNQVNEANLEASFFKPAVDCPQLVLPEALRKSHHPPASFLRYGLPTEIELQALVEGRHPLIAKAEDLRGGKRGAVEKVREVVSRQCSVDKDGYLQWKH
ncbi:3-hydroxyisobutyryl-coenzyme A hydrolase [Multifurca ochricompacta]|uniref:3-hydroxyisobutyryl-CoA hydrolase n=1 Tax=Multifurca ochricompacta TaxID=376703 RepID=A0AAD4QPB9_9AGAM|nr:3-hydroxyisobutyryl-coenzyme A hydrolase [Multifurca ochricompacta]